MKENRAALNISNYILPSISQMVFLVVFIACFSASGSFLLGDGDTGYHIRAGEIILRDMAVPRLDPFSFISPALPWTAHEWLSEVVMALVHKALGMPGIVFLFALLLATTYWLLFRWIRSRGGDFVFDLFILILVVLSSRVHWHARPHVFSLLMMVILYMILVQHQEGRGSSLYVLPLMMIPWVNLHGGYILGLAFMGVYLAGYCIGIVSSQGEEKIGNVIKAKQLSMALAAAVLLSCVNPFGYHAFAFPFRVVSDTYLMDHVHEFLSPNFHEFVPYKYLLLLLIGLIGLSEERLTPTELMLVLLLTSMSLYSVRYIPLCAIVYSPILSRHGNRILGMSNGKITRFLRARSGIYGKIDSSAKGYVVPVLVLCGFVLLANGILQVRFPVKTTPTAAIEFLKANPIPGKMFNNDEIGDFVIYYLYPRYKVFVDGRTDMYGPPILKEYFKVAGLEPDWKDILRKYDINYVFFNTDSILARRLSSDSDWREIYSDNVATIFLRNSPRNADIIGRLAGTGKSLPPGR